ncbi:MAG: zinc ribbon domain-containing protein [candidate division WOR-3 bacterium]|nr:zinc ribbon domain-containing protein [candidate division WOR-3 bacterium]
MPTYEYECETCHHKFEEFQKITDKPLRKCPQCGNKVRRLISAGVGLIFKGSGFYITDYKKQNSSQEKKTSPAFDKKDNSAESKKD